MKLSKVFFCCLAACSISSCSEESTSMFSEIGSSILNSAGVPVSSDSMHSIFSASSSIARTARGFTEEQEYYLGRGVAAVILSKYRPYNDEALNHYINEVGRSVAVFSDRPETFGGYHFQVLDTQEINAVSAPGGFIFISRGFLKVIPNEDALAAVLAHEVGHVVKGHGVAAISQANLTSAFTAIGKEVALNQGGTLTQEVVTSFGDSISDVTNTILTTGYSRSQEYEADEYSAMLLGRAGYDPNALITMLTALKNIDPKTQGSGWFATHPAPEKRVNEVKSTVTSAIKTNAKKGGADPSQAEAIRTARFKAAVHA